MLLKKLDRNYFGIEKEKKYFKAAEQRLEKTIKIENHYLDTIKNNKSKPRIPFGSLVEMGLLEPGMTFKGPAVIEDPSTTIVVLPNQICKLDEYLNLHIDITPSFINE